MSDDLDEHKPSLGSFKWNKRKRRQIKPRVVSGLKGLYCNISQNMSVEPRKVWNLTLKNFFKLSYWQHCLWLSLVVLGWLCNWWLLRFPLTGLSFIFLSLSLKVSWSLSRFSGILLTDIWHGRQDQHCHLTMLILKHHQLDSIGMDGIEFRY